MAMIRSFRDKRTASVAKGTCPKGFPANLMPVAARKMAQIHRMTTLDALRIPPGNRLEALKGDRSGQHSIRINDQWRICFVWRANDAWDVEIVDYH
jgi:proteic killer suppression protein